MSGKLGEGPVVTYGGDSEVKNQDIGPENTYFGILTSNNQQDSVAQHLSRLPERFTLFNVN
jgi:hypothetical protein